MSSSGHNGNRPFDIVVFGATGFTGTLAAKYLAEKYPQATGHSEIRWTIAGRDRQKLANLRETLRLPPNSELVGDVSDQASIDAIVSKTRVVLAAVGPYEKYGTPIVDACVRLQTDCCDLSGEAPWVRKMIDRYHELAQKQRVRIVSSCGFDSIPSDLGCLCAVDYIQKSLKSDVAQVHSYVKAKGGVSGGTAASIMEMMSNPDTKKALSDPFFLNPRGDTPTAVKHDSDQLVPRYSHDLKSYTSPFLMASVNTRVVRRSASFLKYGNHFTYNESMYGGFIFGWLFTFVMGIFTMFASFGLGRKFLSFFLPSPGQGPSEKTMKNGWFKFDIYAHSVDGQTVVIQVKGGEPGYWQTSRMVVESALCLCDRESLKDHPYGVLTPAVAMGRNLVERFNKDPKTGMKFVIEKSSA